MQLLRSVSLDVVAQLVATDALMGLNHYYLGIENKLVSNLGGRSCHILVKREGILSHYFSGTQSLEKSHT